jgi:hypothetical protein
VWFVSNLYALIVVLILTVLYYIPKICKLLGYFSTSTNDLAYQFTSRKKCAMNCDIDFCEYVVMEIICLIVFLSSFPQPLEEGKLVSY